MKNFKTYGQFLTEAYSDEERKELADKGFALSDGSFPIKDLKDLKNAIQAYGRAKDQARAAKFIVKRAKALGAEDLIPDTEDFQKSLGESVVTEGISDKEAFSYLNDLRDSGVTNMLGAGPYLQRAFDLDKRKARQLLLNWMKSFQNESKLSEAKALVSKKDIKDIEDSGNIDIAYKKAMALLKSLSESVAVGSAIHDVSTELPAKAIALPLEDDEEENGSITEGTDLGSWNQGGLKGDKNVLVTTFVGPKGIEDFGLGRKCMQINVGMDYVSLNPADIVELKDLLKSYKVK